MSIIGGHRRVPKIDRWLPSRRFGHLLLTYELLLRRQRKLSTKLSNTRHHRHIIDRKHELRVWLMRIRGAMNRKYPHSMRD